MSDWNKKVPIIGEEYLLHERNDIFNSFIGIYLGRLKEKTPFYLKPKTPEGHLFLGINKGHEMQIYHIRASEGSGPELKVWWFSDGWDDPAWPAGFKVDKLNHNFGKLEAEYLENVFKRKHGEIAA